MAVRWLRVETAGSARTPLISVSRLNSTPVDFLAPWRPEPENWLRTARGGRGADQGDRGNVHPQSYPVETYVQPMEAHMLTTEDVASRSRVGRRAVSRWRRPPACPLRGVLIGRRRLYTEDEVSAFVEWRRAREREAVPA